MADSPKEEAPGVDALDPLEMATEFLLRAIKGLTQGFEDFRVQEGNRALLEAAKTTALIDMARSLRVLNGRMSEIDARLELLTEVVEDVQR